MTETEGTGTQPVSAEIKNLSWASLNIEGNSQEAQGQAGGILGTPTLTFSPRTTIKRFFEKKGRQVNPNPWTKQARLTDLYHAAGSRLGSQYVVPNAFELLALRQL